MQYQPRTDLRRPYARPYATAPGHRSPAPSACRPVHRSIAPGQVSVIIKLSASVIQEPPELIEELEGVLARHHIQALIRPEEGQALLHAIHPNAETIVPPLGVCPRPKLLPHSCLFVYRPYVSLFQALPWAFASWGILLHRGLRLVTCSSRKKRVMHPLCKRIADMWTMRTTPPLASSPTVKSSKKYRSTPPWHRPSLPPRQNLLHHHQKR